MFFLSILKSRRFVKFFFTSVFCVIVEMTFFTISVVIFYLNPLVASPIGQIIGFTLNFLINKFFTFNSKSGFKFFEVTNFVLIFTINIFVSTAILAFLIDNTKLHPTVLRIAVIVVMFFFNYFAISKFVFFK
ncbi:GtrA family protein [Candidatus Dojkabacteria bacterium]|uniref:GtrA family protein n=1 Tax=Candidatus Dojkabacteria bacterium TaxID=2099670 RepID=A0A3M0Z132_9BACT|nr:MAG: GtrA family protein [Candidatus Dojkabacteria bacterium]